MEILPPEVLEKVMRDVDALNDELKAAGAWVFAGGLHSPSTATVVRLQDGEALTTDGPFAEGKEHAGGFSIKAPDPDSALEWGRKLVRATTLLIEVRPFQGEAENGSLACRPSPPRRLHVCSAPGYSGSRRWTRLTRAWSRGRTTSRSMSTWLGRVATKAMHSAMSSALSGTMPS
jgi:hypothetical protein